MSLQSLIISPTGRVVLSCDFPSSNPSASKSASLVPYYVGLVIAAVSTLGNTGGGGDCTMEVEFEGFMVFIHDGAKDLECKVDVDGFT